VIQLSIQERDKKDWLFLKYDLNFEFKSRVDVATATLSRATLCICGPLTASSSHHRCRGAIISNFPMWLKDSCACLFLIFFVCVFNDDCTWGGELCVLKCVQIKKPTDVGKTVCR